MVMPLRYIKANTTIIDIGILSATIAALLTFCKKNNKTRNANNPPCSAASRTPLIFVLIAVD